MISFNFKKMLRVLGLGKKVAGTDTDPYFFSYLKNMPDPNPILRDMGIAEKVYASIRADAHVIGDIRSIRGSLREMNYRVVTWDEDNKQAQAARDLCELWMQSFTPNPAANWDEIMWQMMSSIFTGYKVHEIVWTYWKGYYVPGEILDRPNRRFLFDYDANPLLITKANRNGESVEPYQFVISRHMASIENPYGVALLSSCFWPWTFKTGGWKYFVKYCERHGLPWPIARYSENATDKDLSDLRDTIENMVDSGYALVPDGTGVELLVPSGNGSNLPQESLINLCNREMSKALTGQAMVAELQNTGARAASETAGERQRTINKADADIAAASFTKIFRLITDFNFGEDVPSPELELFTKKQAGKERVETYEKAALMGAKPSRRAMMEELNIPIAVNDDDALVLENQKTVTQFSDSRNGNNFSSDTLVKDAIEAADIALETNVIEPISRMLAQAEKDDKTLADVRADLVELVGHIDNATLRDITDKALVWSYTRGYSDGKH